MLNGLVKCRLKLTCESLIDDIRSCIAEKAAIVDAKQEKLYKYSREEELSHSKVMERFSCSLSLQQLDPVWPQTAHRLLFNQEPLASIKNDGMLECRPLVASGVVEANLGNDEELLLDTWLATFRLNSYKCTKRRTLQRLMARDRIMTIMNIIMKIINLPHNMNKVIHKY